MKTYVAKKKGRYVSELFDPIKLHQSINASCLSVRSLPGEAHMVAQSVVEKVFSWLSTKREVTSDDIRRVTAAHLAVYHPEAAYLYNTYRLVM